MTIQVTVANAYGVAMASDRHVYRGGHALSSGRQAKLTRLRGKVPAAMMSAGAFSVLGVPVSRLAFRFEAALKDADGAGPDGLAEAVLAVLAKPLDVSGCSDDAVTRDLEALARAADLVAGRVMASADPRAGLARVLEEITRAPRCVGGESVEARGRSVWQDTAARLPDLAASPKVAEMLRHNPDLMGEAVISALVHDWSQPADANIMVGLCCPETGVPAVVAVNIWKGLGNQLLFAPRHDRSHYSMHRAGRSLLLSQGSGRPNVCAMIEGVSESQAGSDEQSVAAVDRRWQKTHDRIGVSSPAELVSVATGLVRGAEVIGYLTGDDESSIIEIDAMLLTPHGVASHRLAGTPEGLQPD